MASALTPCERGHSPQIFRDLCRSIAPHSFLASSLFCAGRLNQGRYLHTNPVTVLPPGRHLLKYTHDARRPDGCAGVKRRSPRGYFRGRLRASHDGVWGRTAPTKCIWFINRSHPDSREPFFSHFCCPLAPVPESDLKRGQNGLRFLSGTPFHRK